MFTIVLDAGHGAGRAHNRGGLCYNEGDNNYHFSIALKKELEKYGNIKVILARKKITDNPSVSRRNIYNADLFLSLHSNAAVSSVRGTEVFLSVSNKNSKLGVSLAKALSKVIANCFGHNNRGLKYKYHNGNDYYGVLRNGKAKVSMILEMGFHTNKYDCKFFKNSHSRLAKVIANEVAYSYGLKLKESNKVEVKPVNKLTSYQKQVIENELKNLTRTNIINSPSVWERKMKDGENITAEEVLAISSRILDYINKLDSQSLNHLDNLVKNNIIGSPEVWKRKVRNNEKVKPEEILAISSRLIDYVDSK